MAILYERPIPEIIAELRKYLEEICKNDPVKWKRLQNLKVTLTKAGLRKLRRFKNKIAR